MRENEVRLKPGISRRLAAIIALVLVALVIVLAVLAVFDHPLGVVAELIFLLVGALAVWDALTKKGGRRWLGIAIVGAAGAAIATVQVSGGGASLLSLIAWLIMLAVALGLARYALSRDTRTLKQVATPGTPVPAASKGALIMNLKSGGGKA
ncbi:MAG TPA: hypothetical protein VFH93_13525, partial [Thermoleophilia bacterium]|nr:hypothetical protein [Thermoleophilia bacterium]